jgi:putative ABC transport system permease protein
VSAASTGSGARAALLHAARSLWRGWRSSRLLILLAALALAVATVGSVGLFTARVALALERQGSEALGGDVLLTSGRPISEARRTTLAAQGLATAALTQFQSVALAGERTSLVSVKAVDNGYPLRGQLWLADAAFASPYTAPGVPALDAAWADPQVLAELGLNVGDGFQLGALHLRIGAVIAQEPDRGGGFSNLAPRLIINAAALPASGLLGPGSRASYTLQLAGPAPTIAAVVAAPGEKRITPQEARPELRSALQRAGRFLDIASLAAALLAAAAIAITARAHGAAAADEIALLKTLGAGQRFLAITLVAQLLLLGLLASAIGIGVALAGQALIGHWLAGMMTVELPAAPMAPLFTALTVGLVMLLGFALPPVLQARRTPPLRLLKRATAPAGNASAAVLAVLAISALLLMQTGDPQLALTVLAGSAAAAAALALLAWLAVRALAPLRRTVGSAWRFGLGNIARRQAASVAQAVALGLALLALLLIGVVRQDLLESWRRQLPPDAPNQFLINIQPEQRDAVQAFLQQQGIAAPGFAPMVRARLTALKGATVDAETFADDDTQRWVNREFNLSWTRQFGPDNTLLAGAWWSDADAGQPWLSIDESAAKRLKLTLGDTLTLDFAGTPQTLTVHSIRRVRWDSFKPNFFLATPPGVLDTMPGVQWIASFHLAEQDHGLLPALIRAFPNVTVFDVEATLRQVQVMIDRVVQAVEFVFVFALVAGLLVLLAAIDGTRAERVRETALLRALGARSSTLLKGLLAEYGLLGLISGSVAALAAQLIAWALASGLFGIPYGPRPMLWLTGALAGALLVAALGAFSLRRVLRTPPRQVLR